MLVKSETIGNISILHKARIVEKYNCSGNHVERKGHRRTVQVRAPVVAGIRVRACFLAVEWTSPWGSKYSWSWIANFSSSRGAKYSWSLGANYSSARGAKYSWSRGAKHQGVTLVSQASRMLYTVTGVAATVT